MYSSPTDGFGDVIHTVWNPYTPETLALLEKIREKLRPEFEDGIALERFLCTLLNRGPEALHPYLD